MDTFGPIIASLTCRRARWACRLFGIVFCLFNSVEPTGNEHPAALRGLDCIVHARLSCCCFAELEFPSYLVVVCVSWDVHVNSVTAGYSLLSIVGNSQRDHTAVSICIACRTNYSNSAGHAGARFTNCWEIRYADLRCSSILGYEFAWVGIFHFSPIF
jgi:hypothetical protein